MIDETHRRFTQRDPERNKKVETQSIILLNVIPLFKNIIADLKADKSSLPVASKIKIAVPNILKRLRIRPTISVEELVDLVIEVAKLDNQGLEYVEAIESLEKQLGFFRKQANTIKSEL